MKQSVFLVYIIAFVIAVHMLTGSAEESLETGDFSKECKDANATLYNSDGDYLVFYERYKKQNKDCVDKVLNSPSSNSKSLGMCENGLKALKEGCVDIAKGKMCAATVTWGDDEEYERFLFECVPESCIDNDENELHQYFINKIAQKCNNRNDCKVHLNCDNVLVLPKGGISLMVLSSLVCAFAAWFIYVNKNEVKDDTSALEEELIEGNGDDEYDDYQDGFQDANEDEQIRGEYESGSRQQGNTSASATTNANSTTTVPFVSIQSDQVLPLHLEKE